MAATQDQVGKQERCAVHPDQPAFWVMAAGTRACLTCQPQCGNHPHRPATWYGENTYLCAACQGVSAADLIPAGLRGVPPKTRQQIAMLLIHALSHLWSASSESAPDDATPEQLAEHSGCCPRCCGPCSVIQELLNDGVLDLWVRGNWPYVRTCAWFDPVSQEVRRDWLLQSWANADFLGCHDGNQCSDVQPHGEHEWYGIPPILRRTCPGLPLHLEDSNG